MSKELLISLGSTLGRVEIFDWTGTARPSWILMGFRLLAISSDGYWLFSMVEIIIAISAPQSSSGGTANQAKCGLDFV
jgi:hypothetical protein